ncbi:transporter [Rhodophyticola sp. CCM32]|uniref:OmpP1/FadL family transporter n=1 Tax=Rhodophyticola sp. CCM32 TaxID=2916397 RepID=UPI00107F3B59|nr:transporter [Rhodophyticola sp. CCM32]QBY00346.1 transporter [Rhodophyticola sp. CCM32]
MKIAVTASAALLASTSLASADLNRTNQSMRILFEDVGASGNYVELSYGYASPEANTSSSIVSNPLQSYNQAGLGFLHRFNDQLSFAIIYDQPFGAAVSYPGGTPFFGGNATFETESFTFVGRYEFGNGFSAHAGLRTLYVDGSIFTSVGATGFVDLTGDSDIGFGGLIGVAYEIPDIALRVALTYNSTIDVTFDAVETPAPVPFGTGGAAVNTTFDVEFPDSINLDFQTGIAEDTLLFGGIRHTFWDGFTLTTTRGNYVGFTSDSTEYVIGFGRQFNENWSGSISYTHRTNGTIPSDTALAPTTGLDSLTVAGSYENENGLVISGGVTYGVPGDQIVQNPLVPGGQLTFDDNEVFGVGMRVGFRF